MKLSKNFDLEGKGKSAIVSLLVTILVALGFLAGLGWLILMLVRQVLRWLQELVYTVSTMDTVIIIALISGTITIFGLIVNSMLSLHIKNSESQYKRKAILLKKLEAPYTQFVNMLFDMVQKKEDAGAIDEEVRSKLLRDMSREIILYGSDKVVKKWVSYKKKAPGFTISEHLLYLEDLLLMIREDMGIKKGELTPGDLLSLFVNDLDEGDDMNINELRIGSMNVKWSSEVDVKTP